MGADGGLGCAFVWAPDLDAEVGDDAGRHPDRITAKHTGTQRPNFDLQRFLIDQFPINE